MRYLAILGRQPEISIAELEAILDNTWAGPAVASSPTSRLRSAGVPQATSPAHATFSASSPIDIRRLGGVLKVAEELVERPLDYLQSLPEGKVTIGVSDYSKGATKRSAQGEALKLKKILVRHGRSVRVVENKEAVLSTATSLHNGLSGKNSRKVELIKLNNEWYRVVGVQDVDAYAKRDQARPARDAKVGMLPPKLAQILINLCGPLKFGATVLDPFCGTGVVLQEALLMGYQAYGTDISDRMIEYSEKNLKHFDFKGYRLEVGDATSHKWTQSVAAVACEGYLGKPFSRVPSEMELKEQKQECAATVLGFLKNLAGQVKAGTPVVIAVPAWLREDGHYEQMVLLDEIEGMGYNVNNKSREGLLYYREEQIVARDIIILRKK